MEKEVKTSYFKTIKDYDDYYVSEDILQDAVLKYNITPKEAFKRFLKLMDKRRRRWHGINIYHKSIIDEIGGMQ